MDELTPEEFARLLREGDHPQHPEPEREPDPEAVEAERVMARLLAPKQGHVELIRRLHGTEEE